MYRFALPLTFLALALCGCGTNGDESANAVNASAAGRNENGQLTARVQGVELKVNLPPPIRRMTEDNDFLYPGARPVSGGDGQHFHSDDPPETVAAWYRDPARAGRFSIATAAQAGGGWALTGTERSGDALSVRLAPGSGGGTDGTILVTAAN